MECKHLNVENNTTYNAHCCNTYPVNDAVRLSDLRYHILRQEGVGYILYRILYCVSKDVAYSVNVMQDSGNQFGQEHHVLPVWLIFAAETDRVVVRPLVTCQTIHYRVIAHT